MAGRAHRSRHIALAVTLCIVVPYLACEGLFVVLSGSCATTSLAHRAYSALVRDPALPFDPHNAYTWMILDRREIERRVRELRANGVGIGNSPFGALVDERVAINTEIDGCLAQKPSVRKRMSHLRSNLFNPFDQITYFHDADADLDPELAAFFGRYGSRSVTLTTNAAGERITVPDVEADEIVLVAGDSIANGAMLDDSETLPSVLQRADRSRRYVNLGVSRAKPADIVCALDRAAQRYAGRIDAVV